MLGHGEVTKKARKDLLALTMTWGLPAPKAPAGAQLAPEAAAAAGDGTAAAIAAAAAADAHDC